MRFFILDATQLNINNLGWRLYQIDANVPKLRRAKVQI